MANLTMQPTQMQMADKVKPLHIESGTISVNVELRDEEGAEDMANTAKRPTRSPRDRTGASRDAEDTEYGAVAKTDGALDAEMDSATKIPRGRGITIRTITTVVAMMLKNGT